MDEALTIPAPMSDRNNSISDTIKSFSRRLLGFIRQRVNNEEDAEDILQDVFYQFAGNTTPIEQAGSWLFKVARNKITDNYRKQKLPLADDVFGDSTGEEEMLDWKEIMLADNSDPESIYLRNIFWEELQLALDELPANQREVFIQTEIDNIPFKTIAEESGVAIQTLISRKRYAVLHLREKLKTLRQEILHY